jgi:hypothetical protein
VEVQHHGTPTDVSVPLTILKLAGLSLTFGRYQEIFMVFYTLPAAVAFAMVTLFHKVLQIFLLQK